MSTNSSTERRSPPQPRPMAQNRRQTVQQIDRSASVFIQLVRFIICGLGMSTIAGTAISIIDPPKQLATKVEPPLPKPKPLPLDFLKFTTVSLKLDRQLQTVTQKNSKLDANYLFVEIDRYEYSESGADRVFPAASTIKLPILIALFQDLDAKKVRLEEKLTIDKKSIAEGSGDLQAQKPGTQVSILVAATKMMTISDNTATNLLIARLGGKSALNQRFRNWGLKTTTINNPLPDLSGTNVTTARELARSMMAIERGKIVSDTSRSQILNIMSSTTLNTMLPPGLGAGAKIAHKTGDIGSAIADIGIIELPTGKKYIAAVLVKRAYNDPAGPALIRQMSKIAYTYFQKPVPASSSSSKFQPKTDLGFPNNVFIKNKTDLKTTAN